jgi:hypothetical protein
MRIPSGPRSLLVDRTRACVLWTLLNVVTFWWWEFRLSLIPHWSFGLYLFVCVYASMYYFLSVLLLAGDLEGYDGYRDYFLSRRAWFFGFVRATLDLNQAYFGRPSFYRMEGRFPRAGL